MFSLNGKRCLVVGGSGGIGREVVLGLVEQGASVVFTYLRRSEIAEGLVQTARAAGATAATVRCDVARPGDIEAAVSQARGTLGGLDAVVSTVGWHPFHPLDGMPDEAITRTIETELLSVIRLAQAALPTLVESGGGRFVTIGSDSGKTGNRNASVSAAARGGVIAFTKSIAREYARHNVLANAVCPGPTDTDLWRDEIGTDKSAQRIMEAMVRAIPLKRVATAREVAALAIFLVADEASFITGQAISVSGGLTMS